MQNISPYLIGICGGSASGKTLFLKRLMEKFSDKEICLVSQDNYYKPIFEQPKDHNGIENFDDPSGIDVQRFMGDLKKLKHGHTVQLKEYTFNNKDKVPKTITLSPAPIVLVEGIFVFHYETIREQLDLKIFIDSKEHLKLIRRLKRDFQERGYDVDDVLYRYEHHVTPTFEQYILPYKEEADLIIPNNTHFDQAFGVIEGFITQKIKSL